jgi:hypothetical protein
VVPQTTHGAGGVVVISDVETNDVALWWPRVDGVVHHSICPRPHTMLARWLVLSDMVLISDVV